jgi:hypothetical protein
MNAVPVNRVSQPRPALEPEFITGPLVVTDLMCCDVCHQGYPTPTSGYDGLCPRCVAKAKEELQAYANGGPL